MASELQRIVDSLALRLRKSVSVEDKNFRLQVHSPLIGEVDDARINSILHRQHQGTPISWLQQQQLAEISRIKRISANDELNILSRICAPIRCRESLLGYLWLIDSDESLKDEEFDLIIEAADTIGIILYREQLLDDERRHREHECLTHLFSDNKKKQEQAAQDLIENNHFDSADRIAVIGVRPVLDTKKPSDTVLLAVDLALAQVRREMVFNNVLPFSQSDRGLLLVALSARSSRDFLADLGNRLQQTVAHNLTATKQSWRPYVGIGEPVDTLADAVRSYQQAFQATRIAETLDISEVSFWRDLGIYRTLVALTPADLAGTLPTALTVLLNHDPDLVDTLECFLDLAGDVKKTAEKLQIHRTSLYYRLTKIEQIGAIDLHLGGDRLALHLGLKMARLAGLHPHTKSQSGATSSVV